MFKDIFQIINYLNYNHPGRSKPINLIERETQGNSLENNQDKWTFICIVLSHSLKLFSPIKQKAFSLWYFRQREIYDFYTKQELAKEIGISLATIYRWHNDVLDELNRACKSAGLLE